jgi:hypothetical protein
MNLYYVEVFLGGTEFDCYYLFDYKIHKVVEYVGRYTNNDLNIPNYILDPEVFPTLSSFLDSTEYPENNKFTRDYVIWRKVL